MPVKGPRPLALNIIGSPRSRLGTLLLVLFVIFATDAYGDFTGKGHIHTLAETEQVFLNPDCEATDTCDLKRFSLTTQAHEVWFADNPNNPTYANGAIMEYETDSVAAIEKYAIVQFIKGCVFLTSKNRAGEIQRQTDYSVMSFGENIPLCFPQWVIDSQDTDPVYNSDPKLGRFYLLRWNPPGAHDDHGEKFYGAEKPRVPAVHMADYPAGAFVTASGVKNSSLQFKTCIYKAHEVPAATRRENLNFARPINCFQWQNVYIYDFAEGKFRTDLVDYEQPAEPPIRPSPLVLVSLFIVLAGLASVLWLRKKSLAVKSQPL